MAHSKIVRAEKESLTVDIGNITTAELGKEGGQATYRMLQLKTFLRIAHTLESIDKTLRMFGDYNYDKEQKEYNSERGRGILEDEDDSE